MVITNWRQAAPTIVHQYGIDYKLLKGQADFSPMCQTTACGACCM